MFSVLSMMIDCFSSLIFVGLGILWMTRKDSNKKMKLSLILFATYLLAVFSVVGLPNVSYIRFDLKVNVIPFIDSMKSPISAILNIILFIPFGVFLPLLWPKRYEGWQSVVKSGLLLTLGIELAQLFTLRLTDINDLIMNSFGAYLGFIFYQKGAKRFKGLEGVAVEDENIPPFLTIIFVFCVMFFLGSLLSNGIWELILFRIIYFI